MPNRLALVAVTVLAGFLMPASALAQGSSAPGSSSATPSQANPTTTTPAPPASSTPSDPAAAQDPAVQTPEDPVGQAAQAAGDRDCTDFNTQAEAQDYFESNGGSATNNVDRLDADSDGLACEELSDTPQGGIDTGAGGTAPAASSGIGLPLGVGGALLLLAMGIAAARRPIP